MYRGKLRSGNVDIAKFIACLLIMAHHLHILGIESYPFYNSWIYVEFFLMITGYYTCAHYDGKEVTNKIKDGLSYTLRKFATIFPYTVVVTVLAYVTDGVYKLICHEWSISSFVYSFFDEFFFDVLLLTNSCPLVAPIWYLSATFIVFPFLTLFVQLSNRYLIMLFSFLYPFFYYGIVGIDGRHYFPQSIFRVLAGMLLGVFLYECYICFWRKTYENQKGNTIPR